MPYEFPYAVLVTLFVLASWALVVWGRHLREKNRVRLREIAHEERMLAMQKDVDASEAAPAPGLDSDLESPPYSVLAVAWFRMVALCIGLFLLFAGVGMLVAFSSAESFREMWSVGWIPALGGIGFLLFYRLSRRLASEIIEIGERPSPGA